MWLLPSICAGLGGLELVARLACPGSRVVAYVEREAHSAAILLARMEDSSLAPAPVWCGDLADLDASLFRGVGMVTAGFPCQPWSSAGKGRGFDDERWIWPDIARIIRDVGPRLICLENVPGLLVRGGLGAVLGDLAEMGLDAEWGVLSAAAAGAPHLRERVYVLAYARRIGGAGWGAGAPSCAQGSEDVADADGAGLSGERGQGGRPQPAHPGVFVADADGARRTGHRTEPAQSQLADAPGGGIFPPGPDDLDAWAEGPCASSGGPSVAFPDAPATTPHCPGGRGTHSPSR